MSKVIQTTDLVLPTGFSTNATLLPPSARGRQGLKPAHAPRRRWRLAAAAPTATCKWCDIWYEYWPP
eukprot:6102368-Pleurochrysis_carterae.AAC.2